MSLNHLAYDIKHFYILNIYFVHTLLLSLLLLLSWLFVVVIINYNCTLRIRHAIIIIISFFVVHAMSLFFFSRYSMFVYYFCKQPTRAIQSRLMCLRVCVYHSHMILIIRACDRRHMLYIYGICTFLIWTKKKHSHLHVHACNALALSLFNGIVM